MHQFTLIEAFLRIEKYVAYTKLASCHVESVFNKMSHRNYPWHHARVSNQRCRKLSSEAICS